jgi:peptidyl-dipeptidase Dcp
MKTKIILVMMIALMTSGCQQTANPLLSSFDTPHQTPPFGLIKHEHYEPAFRAAIKEGLDEVDAIASNQEAPTFVNTIEALEFSGMRLNLISDIFFNLLSAETDSHMQEIARVLSPLVSDYGNDILFNEALFQRIKAVYTDKDNLDLSAEQMTLLDKTYKSFARNGAELDKEAQARLREISRELSELSLRFSDNVLAETNDYFLHITDEADLAGLPESVREAAAQAAGKRELEGWVFTLHAPSITPFLQYADKRELRKEIHMAFSKRASLGNEQDNKDILKRIANLRLERANMLGYDTHAHFVLEESMAETPEKVYGLLNQLLDAARPAADREVAEVQLLANELGADFDVMTWDWSYYSEKLRKQRYDLDQEAMRAYFSLEKVKAGIFDLTNRLWGLSYVPNKDIPVYHEEVEAYEVYHEDGTFLAVLFMDFFPREGKGQGAWMTSFRPQYRKGGEDFRPHISVVCNFTRPTDTRPSLLSFYETRTFLHEFGHALHGILSDVNYPGLSGTSVYRDFVELPSMIMENWAMQKDFLDIFAFHYETGEQIPEAFIRKTIEARNFNAGYTILRQLRFGFNDMAWHTVAAPVDQDVLSFERAAMEPAMLLPFEPEEIVSPVFGHIFAGGYSAGYYSYKWSEVLEADAFQLFLERGIFDRATAASFNENILSKGGSEHPMLLYKRFRGSEPSVDALLARDGLL